MLVYLITNKINGKMYVGQTIRTVAERWGEHKKTSAKPSKVSTYLYNAIRKHGAENFEIESLVVVQTKQEMDYYERELIRFLDLRDETKGYNLTDGGDGVLGLKHSEKSKEKNRQAHLGTKLSEEHKRKIALTSLGRTHTEETKIKMSKYVKTDEHRRKISAAKMGNKSRLGMKDSEETKRKRKETIAINRQLKLLALQSSTPIGS